MIRWNGDRYILESQAWLARPPQEVFPFFSDARNLEKLTPSWLKFNVITPDPIVMGVGTLIDYRLKVRMLPLKWRTLISVWDPPYRFVDTQLRGPYRLWIHTHEFEEHEGGTIARDRVEFLAPRMTGGRLAHWLLINRDVQSIFDFRRAALRKLFAEPGETEPLQSRSLRSAP